ncbi:glycosyltransferase [Psychromonas arctica]|uniref:glycosyltransferase n=1 Tax=Psychromonas arctica TaxID=168275 RepID=UPI0003F67E25|nr:glycosyltransferase [Psychromonas arctica]
MKILLDASNIYSGGALQVALTFIVGAEKLKGFEIKYILHKDLFAQISKVATLKDYIVISDSPANSKMTRKLLLSIEESFRPDITFTVFGPTYVKYKYSPHITGFANGWVTHSTLKDFNIVFDKNLTKIIKMLKYVYIGFYLRRADYFIFETNIALKGAVKRLKVPRDNCFIIPNAYPVSFLNNSDSNYGEKIISSSKFKVLCLSSYYKHKNLESLPFVANSLVELGCIDVNFILTLNEGDFIPIMEAAKVLGVDKMIINVGPQQVCNLPKLYSEVSMVYSASNLETFSAIYLESMLAQKVLLLNDKPFARDICGDAALYVNSFEYRAVAQKIIKILNGVYSFCDFKVESKQLLDKYPSPTEKVEAYFDLFKKIKARIR